MTTMHKAIRKSAKLANVCYDIRGPVLERARLLEEEGHRIIKLNIGNLAPFGFDTPDEMRRDVIVNLGDQQAGLLQLAVEDAAILGDEVLVETPQSDAAQHGQRAAGDGGEQQREAGAEGGGAERHASPASSSSR